MKRQNTWSHYLVELEINKPEINDDTITTLLQSS